MPDRPAQVVQHALSVPDNRSRLRDARLNSPPPSIHEEVFTTPLEFAADEFVAASRAALKTARESAERARLIAQSILADQTRTSLAQQRDASEAVHKATGPAIERVQKVIEKLDAKTKALTEFLRGPPIPKDAVKQLINMEARAALVALPPNERRKVILQGLADDDESVLAVLRVAPHVAGMTKLEQEEIRARWAEKYHGPVVRQLAILTTALDATERAGRLLLDYSFSLTNQHEVRQANELSARAQMAIASAGAGE